VLNHASPKKTEVPSARHSVIQPLEWEQVHHQKKKQKKKGLEFSLKVSLLNKNCSRGFNSKLKSHLKTQPALVSMSKGSGNEKPMGVYSIGLLILVSICTKYAT
jgi:hypothetical protein